MKRILLTIGNKKDLLNFEECVSTQNEWATKNEIEHTIVELEDTDDISWGFYKTFISNFLNNENITVAAMMPHVMILETFNPLFKIEHGIAVNTGETSFLMGKHDGSPIIKTLLEKSLDFMQVENVSCNLALEILSLKTMGMIYFIDNLITKPNYPRLIQELDQNRIGFEIHANTNKDNKFTISHDKYDNYSYIGGEFGVNLNLNNLDLSKGFILEFKKIKDKILETRDQLQKIHIDLN